MPVKSTDGAGVRITKSEYQEMTAAAHRMDATDELPDTIKTEADLEQAQSLNQQAQLLEWIFGDTENGESPTREACERGELTEKDVFGFSREEMAAVAAHNG